MTASDEHRQMVADCEAREARLSEWEAGRKGTARTCQRGSGKSP